MTEKDIGLELNPPKRANRRVKSVVSPSANDGAAMLNGYASSGGYYAQMFNADAIIKNENDLIRRYRELAQRAEVESAIEDVVTEAIVYAGNTFPCSINLDDVALTAAVKKKIEEEFEEVLHLYNAENLDEIFRTWYIDGRIHYYVIIDPDRITDGIVELRYIDPRKIKKVKDVKKIRTESGLDVIDSVDEYYLFNDNGIEANTLSGVRLTMDSVIYAHSGIYDSGTNVILSYLHKAIRPANQLKMMEDATVIYKSTRAVDRRVFYIDVGNLPKLKAEQYVQDVMSRFTNKIVYNPTTGEVGDTTKNMSMLEDYFLARRDGGKATEIVPLQGSSGFDDMSAVAYFRDLLYKSLNIPSSRHQSDAAFNIGRPSEITRDEVKFSKFVNRLRRKFSTILLDALRIQIITKKIINENEWEKIKKSAMIDYEEDNHFAELKEIEVLNNRIQTLGNIETYVGKYFSDAWVKKHVLKFNESDIRDMDAEIEAEKAAAPTDDDENDNDMDSENDSETPEFKTIPKGYNSANDKD